MNSKLTKILALDCEMVDRGEIFIRYMVGRVSIVNENGVCIYDKFVKPRERVYNYWNLRKSDVRGGEEFGIVQEEVKKIIHGRIVVGHSLEIDFKILEIEHPSKDVRDIALYLPFEKMYNKQHGDVTPPLEWLAARLVGMNIQLFRWKWQYISTEAAQAAMKIYQSVAQQWEANPNDVREKLHVPVMIRCATGKIVRPFMMPY